MESDMKIPTDPDRATQQRLAQIREKIDRGLKQLDEGRGVSAEDARARLRWLRKKP
jgi:hypothetical protein